MRLSCSNLLFFLNNLAFLSEKSINLLQFIAMDIYVGSQEVVPTVLIVDGVIARSVMAGLDFGTLDDSNNDECHYDALHEAGQGLVG